MKLLNQLLIGLSCVFFGIYFALTMLILFVCYLFKAIYYQISRKGNFKINPFNHANPDVLKPTSILFIYLVDVLTLDGFRIDTYTFLTDDKCTLTVWRVVNLDTPISKPYPIFLQHGLLDCSVSWFLQQDKYLLLNLEIKPCPIFYQQWDLMFGLETIEEQNTPVNKDIGIILLTSW